MADPSMTIIAIDNQFLFWLVGIFATIIGILLVTLGRVIVKGFHSTLHSCHDSIMARVENHEVRIRELEHATFRPINGGNYGHDHVP